MRLRRGPVGVLGGKGTNVGNAFLHSSSVGAPPLLERLFLRFLLLLRVLLPPLLFAFLLFAFF